jgi:hypothetical protein
MPLTPKQFRQLALSFHEAEEHAHMHHPDFRVAGKIFATLGYPDKSWGMVKLTPEQQAELMHDEPKVFVPRSRSLGPKRQHHSPPQIREERDRAPSPKGRLAQHRPQKFVSKIRTFRRLRIA